MWRFVLQGEREMASDNKELEPSASTEFLQLPAACRRSK